MKTQACSTVVGEAKCDYLTIVFSNHQQYSYWNISLFYYSMSGHQICVWAQTYTFLPRHDCDHTIITCQGTNVSGHKHVWAQSCLVTGHNLVGSSMYGHKHVVSVLKGGTDQCHSKWNDIGHTHFRTRGNLSYRIPWERIYVVLKRN